MVRFVLAVIICTLVGCGDTLNTPTSPTHSEFQLDSPCVYSFFIPKVEVSSRAQKIAIQVVTGKNCSWAASSTDPWITVTSQVITGTGLLAFELSPNQCTSQPLVGKFRQGVFL